MTTRRCWTCGKPCKQSAFGNKDPFYLEVRIVDVFKPFSANLKSKPVWICDSCAVSKVGMTREGKNLNK